MEGEPVFQPNQEDSAIYLRDVEPIEGQSVYFASRSEIRERVERPLVSACEELYDKGIETNESSANKKNISGGFVDISLNYDTLSPENQAVAQDLINEGLGMMSPNFKGNYFSIFIPVSENSAVNETKSKVEAVVHRFLHQPPIWIKHWTMEQFKKAWGYKPEETPEPEEFTDCYYDPQAQLFFRNEEQAKKYQAE